MSEENVELVRRLFAAWNRGDAQTLAELLVEHLHPEFELHTLYFGQVYKGAESALDFLAEAGEIAQVVEVADGRLQRIRLFMTWEEALEAAGLPE